ncbi:sigma-54-dependent transcriptional regulator [Parabacteroides pacaensis]|uniref:sigma-54-dependent transcriptional regulator n=1 Tax=Parabacteroides pacaensis TaxID=2086575 RepID=UPI000D0FBB1A|nr:sigma-54 dependent transcriptional regulator [Parabacteroides pacaensis]
MIPSTILIVDDNKSVLTSLELLLENEFDEIITANNPQQIESLVLTSPIDLVILDMNFKTGVNNGNEGLFWLKRIHEFNSYLPVIMLTAYGDIELAVKAMKLGASDFILKPWDNHKLIEVIQNTLKESVRMAARSESKKNKLTMVLGTSPAMMKLLKMVNKVARTNANILITGENGTGKEMLACEIHRLSLRNNKEMVSVDMGAISESLFESELFGHEKGAFTDAKECRIGKFEAADNSTLFLDEIGNLSFALQAKLLVTLQNREITRIGSNRKIPIDIRLITATNRNIDELVKQGSFREDLLYRINTIHLEIPPLRERREDIPLLTDYFLKKYASQYKQTGIKIHHQALEKLKAYSWPGNIRELQHTIEKAVILCEGEEIKAKDILVKPHKGKNLNESSNLTEIEKNVIEATIAQNKGNLKVSAKQLGISRQTLYNKIKRFKI